MNGHRRPVFVSVAILQNCFAKKAYSVTMINNWSSTIFFISLKAKPIWFGLELIY